MNVLLIGPQGSGKGTQAKFLIERFGLRHVEAGAIVREAAKEHTHKAEIIDHLVNQKGLLLPDGVILDLIEDKLEKTGFDNLLFDGFPRTLNQYNSLKALLASKNSKLDWGVYLDISDEESLKRLSSRRICKECGAGYSLELEPDRTACECGGVLISRPDDTPEAIGKRLSLFHEMTDPVLEELEKDGVLLKVNGEQEIEVIAGEVISKLGGVEKNIESEELTNLESEPLYDSESPSNIDSETPPNSDLEPLVKSNSELLPSPLLGKGGEISGGRENSGRSLKGTYYLISFLSALVVVLFWINYSYSGSGDDDLVPLMEPTPVPTMVLPSPTPMVQLEFPEFPFVASLEWSEVSVAEQYLGDEGIMIEVDGEPIETVDLTGSERMVRYQTDSVNFENYLIQVSELLEAEGWSREIAMDGYVVRPINVEGTFGSARGWVRESDGEIEVFLTAIFSETLDETDSTFQTVEIRQFVSQAVAGSW